MYIIPLCRGEIRVIFNTQHHRVPSQPPVSSQTTTRLREVSVFGHSFLWFFFVFFHNFLFLIYIDHLWLHCDINLYLKSNFNIDVRKRSHYWRIVKIWQIEYKMSNAYTCTNNLNLVSTVLKPMTGNYFQNKIKLFCSTEVL